MNKSTGHNTLTVSRWGAGQWESRMAVCWVRKGVYMTAKASPCAKFQRNKEKAVGWDLCVCMILRVCFLIWVCIVLQFSSRSSSCSIVAYIGTGMERKHITKCRYEGKGLCFSYSSRNISKIDWEKKSLWKFLNLLWTLCLYLNKKVLLLRTEVLSMTHSSDSQLTNFQTRTRCQWQLPAWSS